MGNDLYVFIDESGNFDFSPRGTRNFVLTAITTTQPIRGRDAFDQLQYKLLANGHDQASFHATEDKQFVRDQIFKILDKMNDFSVDSVIAQKNKANPSLYQEIKGVKDDGTAIVENTDNEFYRLNCQVLLQYIFRRYENSDYSKTIVVLSSLFTNKKRGLILKALKPYFKNYTSKPYYIYFHSANTNLNCQIADYCSWAIYVKHERNELRPFQEIENKIVSEFDIFRRGRTTYYHYEK